MIDFSLSREGMNMFKRFANWLRHMEATWAAASRSDTEILASELAKLREKVRKLEAKD